MKMDDELLLKNISTASVNLTLGSQAPSEGVNERIKNSSRRVMFLAFSTICLLECKRIHTATCHLKTSSQDDRCSCNIFHQHFTILF